MSYQDRVISEKEQLDKMIMKLNTFSSDGNEVYSVIGEKEQLRLAEQLNYMKDYSRVLGERIAAFPTA